MIAAVVSVFIDKHSFYDQLRAQYIHDIQQQEDAAVNTDENKGAPLKWVPLHKKSLRVSESI